MGRENEQKVLKHSVAHDSCNIISQDICLIAKFVKKYDNSNLAIARGIIESGTNSVNMEVQARKDAVETEAGV